MPLTPQGYLPRVLDGAIEKYLRAFGAVQVDGPKWCGKTWACLNFANSIIELDDPNYAELVRMQPDIIDGMEKPCLLDEWQDVPMVRDKVRRLVDRGKSRGSFLLTGSSNPSRETYSHSGAGRITGLRMRPMSLLESGDSTGSVSIDALFAGETVPNRIVSTDLKRIAELICRGGWPGSLDLPLDAALLIPADYLDRVADDNITHLGLSPTVAKAAMVQLARTEGTSLNLTELGRSLDVPSDNDKTLRNEASRYLEAFATLYLVEKVFGWDAPVKARSRRKVKPKVYFCDPSLGAAALSVTPERLISQTQVFGTLFESLCMRDLLVYTSAGTERTEVHYFRDQKGFEVDAIIERADGSWGAFEIKLGSTKEDQAAENLLKLKGMVSRNPAARNPDPSFLAVLVGSTPWMGTRPDGVQVIPITELGV